MTAGRLAVKLESTRLEFPYDIAIAETRETAHLRSHHDRVVPAAGGRGERDFALPFAPGLDEFPSYIPCDLKRLCNRPPLRHQPREFVGCCQVKTFRQFINLDANREFHV